MAIKGDRKRWAFSCVHRHKKAPADELGLSCVNWLSVT